MLTVSKELWLAVSVSSLLVLVSWTVTFTVLHLLEGHITSYSLAELQLQAGSLAASVAAGVRASVLAVDALEAFVLGSLAVNATEMEMLQQFYTSFGPGILSAAAPNSISGLYLAPAGVVSAAYPTNASTSTIPLRVGYWTADLRSRVNKSIVISSDGDGGGVLAAVLPESDGRMVLILRRGINESSQVTGQQWAGDIVLTAFIDQLVESTGLVSSNMRGVCSCVMYSINTVSLQPQEILFDASGVKRSSNVVEEATPPRSCSSETVTVIRSIGNEVWYITVETSNESRYFSPSSIVMIVLFPILVVVVVSVLMNLLPVLWRKLPNKLWVALSLSSVDAPKTGPLVAVMIGVHQSDLLWANAPQAMIGIQKIFEQRLESLAPHRNGYITDATLHHAQCVVFKSIKDAIALCEDMIESFTHQPYAFSGILPPIAASSPVHSEGPFSQRNSSTNAPVLSPEGENRDDDAQQIQVCCVVHWCDLIVMNHNMEGGASVTYSGQDVMYAKRIFQYAAPDTIVLSKAAANAASSTLKYPSHLELFTTVRMRRVQGPQELFYIVDPESHAMRMLHVAAQHIMQSTTITAEQQPRSGTGVPGGSIMGHSTPAFWKGSVTIAGGDTSSTGGERAGAYGGDDLRNYMSGIDSGKPLNGIGRDGSVVAPRIPTALREQIASIFESVAAFSPVAFDDMALVIFHYMCAFRVLFRPFAQAERKNLQRRLVVAFGIPLDNFVEHLAVRCALQHIAETYNTKNLVPHRSGADDDEHDDSDDHVV